MKNYIVAFILVLLSIADASAQTTVARFVKSGCSFNGNGTANTCAASGGAVGAHQTLTQLFTTNAARNLVTSTEILDITVSGATADVWDGDYQAIVSNPTYYVRIRGDVTSDGAHAGLRSNTRFRIANNTYNGTLEPRNLVGCAARIENIQIVVTTNTDNTARGTGVSIRNNCSTGEHRITGNIISYESTTLSVNTSNNGVFIDQASAARTEIIANNVIVGFRRSGISLNNSANEITIISNNTVSANTESGIYLLMYGATDTVNVRNNYLGGNSGATQYYAESTATTFATANNLTSDATSPNGAAFQTKTCGFIATGSTDYHLAAGATNCINNAANLSADASYAFAIDFERETRPGTWDIGADEFTIATQQTQYIDTTTACAGNDGTIGNPYCSYTEWETQNRNLLTENINLLVIWSGPAEVGQWVQDGWTTDATHAITYSGFKLASTAYGAAVTLADGNITIRDSLIGKTAAGVNITLLTMDGQNDTLERNIFYGGPAFSRDSGFQAIWGGNGGLQPAKTVTVRNNVFYRLFTNALEIVCSPNDVITIDNNTFYDISGTGINLSTDSGSCAGGVYTVRNNIVQVTGTADYSIATGSGTLNTGSNISEDLTSPNVPLRSTVLAFNNIATNNYRLAASDTAAIGSGVNLSSAGVTVDKDNITRTVPFDIGAYKYISAILNGSLTTLKVSGAL